ncbi:hypothetical protein ACVMAJ_006061 [Bradyrhizobium sp. USDA 4448]
MRHRSRGRGRTLRRCRRPVEFGPRRREVRGSPRRRGSEVWGRTGRRCSKVWGRTRWRCGEVRRRMRRHRRWMERGRGGTGHGRRRRRTSHRRWRGWTRSRCRWSPPSIVVLGGRVDARRDHRSTNQKRRKAHATRKHDCRSQLVIAHNFQRADGGLVRCCSSPCDLPTQAVSREILRQVVAKCSRAQSTWSPVVTGGGAM